jgi:hypothetical protein
MKFSEQQTLALKQAQRLVQDAAQDYREKSILEEAVSKIRNLEVASWIPSVFSIVTASFLVFYLAQPYPLLTKIVIILILGAVIIVNEIVKRRTVKASVRDVHRNVRPALVIMAGGVLTVIISMGSSFVGGNNGVQQNVPRPTLAANPTVDSLDREIAALNQSIATYENTTWKGRIVRDANKNLTIVNSIKADLLAQKSALQEKDQQAYQATLAKFETQLISFGWIFGGLAALCDIFLIMIRFAIERIRRDLYDAYGENPALFAAAITDSIDFLPKGPTPPPSGGSKPKAKMRALRGEGPAPTDSHHPDQDYDPADLVDETGSYSVATPKDEHAREREVRKTVAAYKDAKKNLDAWLRKEQDGKGNEDTLNRNIRKYQSFMETYMQELEELGAHDEIAKLKANVRA